MAADERHATSREETELSEGFVPKARYLSREFAARENEYLWPRVWQFACREDELPEVGSYVEYRIADESIIVVRASRGEIKAYFNACRHRGRKLVTGAGRVEGRHLRCPYYGWCWNLKGENTFAMHREDFHPARKTDAFLKLVECRVGTWAGFVFVNMDPEAPSLERYLAPLTALLDPLHIEKQHPLFHKRAVLGANWKAVLDAFTESYHALATHPESAPNMLSTREDVGYFQLDHGHSYYLFAAGMLDHAAAANRVDPRRLQYDFISYEVDCVRAMAVERDRQVAAQLLNREIPAGSSASLEFSRLLYEHAAGAGIDLPVLDASSGPLIGGLFYFFPNLIMLTGLGSTLVYRMRPSGSDPDSCVFEIWSTTLFPRREALPPYRCEEPGIDDSEAWGLVPFQDIQNMVPTQTGMKSRSFAGLNLSLCEEVNIFHMRREIDRYVSRK